MLLYEHLLLLYFHVEIVTNTTLKICTEEIDHLYEFFSTQLNERFEMHKSNYYVENPDGVQLEIVWIIVFCKRFGSIFRKNVLTMEQMVSDALRIQPYYNFDRILWIAQLLKFENVKEFSLGLRDRTSHRIVEIINVI